MCRLPIVAFASIVVNHVGTACSMVPTRSVTCEHAPEPLGDPTMMHPTVLTDIADDTTVHDSTVHIHDPAIPARP